MTLYRVEALFCGEWLPVATIAAKSWKAALQKGKRDAPENLRRNAMEWRAIVAGNKSGRSLGKVAGSA